MALLLDIVLISILALCVFVGWKKGFIRSLSGFVIYIISFALSNSLYRLISVYFIKIPLLQNMITDVEMPVLTENATFLDKIKEIFDFIKESTTIDNAEGTVERIQAILNNYIADILASALAFIVIFIASVFILKLLFWVFDTFITKLPVIKQANGFLGGVIGLFTGLIWTWALSNIFIQFFLPFLNQKWPAIFVMEIADSFVVNLCTKINPITYLFALINLIS